MPQIAELKVIDGATWARVDVTGDEGRIQILSDAEVMENDRLVQRLLAKIEELQKCGSCGEPISRDCPNCRRLWES